MLTFFRTNQLFSSITLVFYILLLRFSVFVAPFKWNPSGEGLLGRLLYEGIGSQTIIAHFIAMSLLLMQGFLINYIVLSGRLSNEVNLFPGVFYVLVSCLLPDFLYLSPVLVGNTFILIALTQLLATYKVSSCSDRIFNAGFWTGVASLFYFPFLFYFVLLNAGMNILRGYNIRERLGLVIGMFLPFFLCWLGYFVIDRTDFFWETQFEKNLSFLDIAPEPGWEGFVKAALFGVAILFVILNNGNYLTKRNIQSQKSISILYWVMISALVGAFFQANLSFEHLVMLAPPLGVFLAFTFTNLKSQWAESGHFLLVLLALVLQWVPWQL